MDTRTPIKLYLDEHIWPGLAVELRQRGYDAITVHKARRQEASDEEQLTYASASGRAILTFNKQDFIPLAAKWFYEGKSHAGIIVSQQISQGELLRRTERLLASLAAEEMKDTVRFLEDFKEK